MHHIFQQYRYAVYRLMERKYTDWIFLIPLVMLALFKNIRYFLQLLNSERGLPQSDDGTWYINYANTFIVNLTDGLDMNDVLYLGYNALLTGLLTVLQDPAYVVLIQAVTAALSTITVYKIAQLLFNRTTAVIAALFYCLSFDVTLWAMYILADSFFVSLLLLCVFFLLKALDSPNRKYRMLFFATSFYLAIFKPTGILSLLFFAFYVLVRVDRKTLTAFLYKHRFVLGGLVLFACCAVVYLYGSNKLETLVASLQFNAKKVLYNIYARGWIYDKPTSFDHFFRPNYTIDILDSLIVSFIVNNWDHISIVYVRRALAFIGRWTWENDLTTLTGTIMFLRQTFIPVLFVVGTAAAIRHKLFWRASILWLMVFSVFLFCVIFFIDWMYRYKLPAIPFIAIVAAYGAEGLFAFLLRMINKHTGLLSDEPRENSRCHSGV